LYPNFQGCGCNDPDHSYSGGRTEYDRGNCDGWLKVNDIFSIGYYVQTNLPFFGQIAPIWTVCDNYFAAIMAETQPNRIYQHAAQTDCLTNRGPSEFAPIIGNPISLPTIWDTLVNSNISAAYYHAGVARALDYWGLTYQRSISHGISQFFYDCEDGNLPAVSFVDPVFTSASLPDLDTGGNDDHPHSDIRNGEAFLANIYNAIASSPQWASTVLIINFDEWGGFFDHVPPTISPQVPDADQQAYAAVGILPSYPSYGLRGFRVPCLVISPWSRGHIINTTEFDHCSVLKMIENRWGLVHLTVRDLYANDLAQALDLEHPKFIPPPQVQVPTGVFGGRCQSLQIVSQPDGSVAVNWDSTCYKAVKVLWSTEPEGPWQDLLTATNSPYLFTPSGPYRFFQGVYVK
jgi:phospholipase C